MAALKSVAVAWFTRDEYDRVRAISDDEMIPSFDDWEAKMTRILGDLASKDVRGEKVFVTAVDLCVFARGKGKIDSNMRAAFAAALLAQKRERKQ
jgi:hypothetical protein